MRGMRLRVRKEEENVQTKEEEIDRGQKGVER